MVVVGLAVVSMAEVATVEVAEVAVVRVVGATEEAAMEVVAVGYQTTSAPENATGSNTRGLHVDLTVLWVPGGGGAVSKSEGTL